MARLYTSSARAWEINLIALIVPDASEPVGKCEFNGMNPSKESNVNPPDKHDRPEDEAPQLVPSDLDVDEGDEEKDKRNDLPPAMPPVI